MVDGMGKESFASVSAPVATESHVSDVLLTSVQDIQDFDRLFWEVTKGLPIRTGSILRVPGSAFHRWGIKVTDENREALAELSEDFRIKDYQEIERFDSPSRYEKTAFSQSVKTQLARLIGLVVKEVLKDVDDGEKEYRICDLAAGLGRVSSAIATALRSDRKTHGILDRTTFYLVDHSGESLAKAQKNLNVYSPLDVRAYPMWDESFLEEKKEFFDIIVSLCHFHKKPFPDIFRRVHGALKDDGVLVSGDWHSAMCDHPLYVYQLLEKMRVESRRLDMYRELFGGLFSPDSCPDLNEEQARGIIEHQSYWAEVYHELLKSSSNMTRDPRIYILGAFDTTEDRLIKLRDAGFETDINELRKAFPKAKLPNLPKGITPAADRASLIMGLKRHGG